jgi:hypothetical protein
MKTKSRNEIVKLAAAYLNKTSNHLFTTADGYLYKIETFEREGKLYYATIFLGNGKVIVDVKEAISERQFTWYGNNTLNVLQQELFPKYFKAKSIPYFKKMKEIIKDLMSELKVNNADNKELIEKIKTRLPELEKVN